MTGARPPCTLNKSSSPPRSKHNIPRSHKSQTTALTSTPTLASVFLSATNAMLQRTTLPLRLVRLTCGLCTTPPSASPIKVTAAMVKSLREATGAPMMDCKKALSAVEVNGDADLAVEWLRKKGVAAASAKAGRATNDGLIGVVLSAERRKGGIVEVNCETDFVARNNVFQDLVDNVARTVLQTGLSDVEALKRELLEEADGTGTVEEGLISATANVGENITLNSANFVALEHGAIGTYVHNKRTPSMGTKVALVALTCEETTTEKAMEEHQSVLQRLADNLAMHIVGADPEYLTALPESLVERERAIESEKVRMKMAESGKEVSEDVLQGRVKKKVDKELAKLTQEKVLLKQPYIAPDAAKSDKVETVLNRESKGIGAKVSISTALLFRVGEAPVVME